MSRGRRGGRRGRKPAGRTPSGLRELYNVALPMRGGEKRRFLNDLSDRLVVMAGVAAAVVGFGSGGVLGAMIGLALGLLGASRTMVRGRFRRG
jgi:type IV secretory pathway TrbD component